MVKKSKSERKNKTLVTLLLDRSLSMESVKSQTLEAFNAYVGELKGSKADIRMSLIYFDYHGGVDLEKVFVAKKIKDVELLTAKDYSPRGSTPLLDAAGTTIRAIEKSIEGRDDVNVVMVIQTDGEENASQEIKNADLRAMIQEKEKCGWQFIFMGCGIDAYGQAGLMGLSADRTLSYGKGGEHTKAAFAATAQNTRAFAEGIVGSTMYSSEQKLRSGDGFAPGAAPAPTNKDKDGADDDQPDLSKIVLGQRWTANSFPVPKRRSDVSGLSLNLDYKE